MNKPTCEQMLEEDGMDMVFEEADPSWRHGCYMTQVYKRFSDNTFWEANFCLSGDGEHNGLRENEAEIYQVEPYEITRVEYRKIKQEETDVKPKQP